MLPVAKKPHGLVLTLDASAGLSSPNAFQIIGSDTVPPAAVSVRPDRLVVGELLRSASRRERTLITCAVTAASAAVDCACAVSETSSPSASAVACGSIVEAVDSSLHRARKSASSAVSVDLSAKAG